MIVRSSLQRTHRILPFEENLETEFQHVRIRDSVTIFGCRG